jgi:hypothetical protein
MGIQCWIMLFLGTASNPDQEGITVTKTHLNCTNILHGNLSQHNVLNIT